MKQECRKEDKAEMQKYGSLRLNNATASELDKRAKQRWKRSTWKEFRTYLEENNIAPGSYWNALSLKWMREDTLKPILTKFGFNPQESALFWTEDADERAGYGTALVRRFQEEDTDTEAQPIVDTLLSEPELTRGEVIDKFLNNVDHGVLDCVITCLSLEARVTRRATYLERVSETVAAADNSDTIGLRVLEEAFIRCGSAANP